MKMETGYPGETEKLYLARQGWGLQSSVSTETYPGWRKDKRRVSTTTIAVKAKGSTNLLLN